MGERMQLLATGSTVQRPELMMKSGGDGGGEGGDSGGGGARGGGGGALGGLGGGGGAWGWGVMGGGGGIDGGRLVMRYPPAGTTD